ncbi:MAG: hypothetical protein KAJ21_06150 [Thermoplasmatales archaeon]|nr:hypothetical protein [Thermoplasmatales archaeon]
MPIKKPEDFDFDKENDIEKRKPKPFRYLKTNELPQEEDIDEDKTFTFMKTDQSKIKSDYINPVVLSNNKTIGKVEEIIKKHEDLRKLKEFY